MRRIFTLSFALVCLFATQNLFAQGSCTAGATTAPSSVTFNASRAVTTANQFTSTNQTTLGVFPKNATTELTSPIYYYNSSQNIIYFAYTLEATGSGGPVIPTIQILYGSPLQTLTCTATSFTVATTPTTYYFSYTPTTPFPASTNFQIRLQFAIASSGQNVTASSLTTNAISTTGNAVLPVHFSKVAVQKAAEAALITWNVGTEQNVSSYDVEKSTDGRSFTKIGFVAAQGLSSYSFADTKAGAVNFYRIKSVDLDGKYSLSTVVVLNNGAASVVVKAFMSDKNTLTVQHDAAQAGSRISVVSMDGRVVKLQQPNAGAQQTTVDLSSAQTGLYIVRYDNGQGGTQSIKVAK